MPYLFFRQSFGPYVEKLEDGSYHNVPFEMVLDFFYQGKLDPSDERMILPIFKLAYTLKCQTLFEKSMEAIKKALGVDTAPRFLIQCIDLGNGLEKIAQACKVLIAKNFDAYAEVHLLFVTAFC